MTSTIHDENKVVMIDEENKDQDKEIVSNEEGSEAKAKTEAVAEAKAEDDGWIQLMGGDLVLKNVSSLCE